ncbi:unnamed protein product [Brassica oleracea var. botrytis]
MVVLSMVALVKTAYSLNSFVFEAEDIVFGSPWWFAVVGVACLLVLFAGIMSGLTLGLMSLGLVELEILQQSGSSAEKKQAAAILPVVKKQHQLLVTLLLCNAAAMEALPICLDKIFHPFVAVLLSVTFVLAFGEIIPQAICSRYGLAVGANFLWLVRILMIICYPIAYPIGKVLDAVIGHNNTLFRRAQLKALVSIHSQEAGKGGELTHEETMIISGALDLSEKTAEEAMTPIESTFSLDVTTKLDWETIGKILSKGHSRIPVYLGNPKNIIGLLLVKSLLTVRAEAETPISSVSIRKIPRVPSDMPLYDILNEFQKGSSHMAAVVKVKDKDKKKSMQLLSHEETPKENINLYTSPHLITPLLKDDVVVVDIDKAPKHVENRGNNFKQNGIVTRDLPCMLEDSEDEEVIGIITLEDVFEELLQADIVDETDVYIDVHKKVRVAAAAAAVSSIARASPVEYRQSKGGVTVKKLVGKEARTLVWFVNSMDNKGPVLKTVVLEPFIKLVRLLARAFYDDYTTKSDNQQKTARSDNRGIAVVVLDELTRKQWVREEDLAKELKLHAKQLRKIIRHFEEQNLIMRDHRKETAKGAKMYSVAVAATTGGRAEDKVKFHTHSYCCLNYPQIYDIVRYKLHRMKKKLKDELEDKNTVQEYGCPNCQRKYNALDALRLISMEDDAFHCENCNGELVVECNKLTSEEVADGDDNARRRRREKLRDMLQKMEVQIKPLMDQINRVKDLPVPDFGSLIAWEARAAIAARENGELNPNDPLRSQGGYGSTPMPFLGETKVEVNLGEGKEDVTSNGGDSSLKVLPPWMIKQGMNLTEEQRGEMRHEAKVDVGSSKLSDDKKSAMESGDDKDLLKDEYFKAYYAALIQQQQDLAQKQRREESGGEVVAPDSELASTSSDRQVGMKSKREEEEDEWEEEVAPVPVAGNGNYKVDLNVEAAEASGELTSLMGFTSVYRSLTQIFPQVDARMLRAVAIEHPKDPDEAASVVLSEILPSLPTDSTQSRTKSSPIERDLEDAVSKYNHDALLVASSSETIPLVTGRRVHDTIAPSALPNVGPGVVCHKDVGSEEQVQSLGKAPGQELGNYDFFGKCFDVPSPILPPPQIDLLHVTEDHLASVFPQDNAESTRDFRQKLGFHMTWNQAEDSITSIGSLNAAEKGSCFEVGKGSVASENGDTESKSSVTSVNGDTEVGGAFSSSTHGCSVDHLEEIIEDAKTNKKTLLAVMDSVTNLMKEVELEEKDAEKSESEAARGGLDTLEKVEEFKNMLKHAKEANDINAGEVYGEKSILATEAKELENRLLNLSEERNKSLAMRETLEIRLAAALEMKKAAEQEKKAKEDSTLKALAEQEAIMEKVVEESKLLQQEAEQNSKLLEFLMDRGQVVDSLQGEISVICQDVKLLKEKFDNRVSIPKKAGTSSLTSSCGSSVRSLVLETPAEPLNGMLKTSSSKNKSPEEEDEEASSTMDKLKNDCRELLEDGWDIFDKDIEL